MIELRTALTYDDVQLIPHFSDISSRSDIDLTTRLTRNVNISLPFIASCMDTICEIDMVKVMAKLGAAGCIHRFMSIDEQVDMVILAHDKMAYPIMAAVGVGDSEMRRAAKLVRAGVEVILIDVAHGHHIKVKEMIGYLVKLRNSTSGHTFDIIGGSIATAQAALDLCEWGVDGLRVGIGGGSICSTRIQTGHGVPSITSISECADIADQYDVPIIADGGLKSSGDIAKAIAFGADTVMLGSLIAGTKETPTPYIPTRDGLYKKYRGSASLETKQAHGLKSNHVEGISIMVRDKGGVKFIINDLSDGLKSALSYTGARTIEEFQVKAHANRVTPAGSIEASTHILTK